MRGGKLTRLPTIIAAGFVCGVLAVVLAIGNATLFARHELEPFLPAVVGVVLVGAAITPVLTALLSTIRGQVTTTQEIAVVALGSVIAATTFAYDGDPIPATTSCSGSAAAWSPSDRAGALSRHGLPPRHRRPQP